MIRALTLSIVLAPLSAHAELQPAVAELMPYMDVTAACFDGAEDSNAAVACVGQGSGLCMASETDGQTTVGMMFCTLAEYEAWDRLLNRDYGPIMDGLQAMDDQDVEFFPEFANRADSLRDAQRAWIPLRDTQCALEYAMWGAGSMRQIAGASCLLDLTAKRVIYLRFMGEGMRG
jgi:uncharacterized protein YecT (DUF1311 family)